MPISMRNNSNNIFIKFSSNNKELVKKSEKLKKLSES